MLDKKEYLVYIQVGACTVVNLVLMPLCFFKFSFYFRVVGGKAVPATKMIELVVNEALSGGIVPFSLLSSVLCGVLG